MVIYIAKKPVSIKNNAFRLDSVSSVPDFLRTSFRFNADRSLAQIVCVEGTETVPVGKNACICWEESKQTPTGYNLWVKGNAATTLTYDENKKVYRMPTSPDILITPLEAELVLPTFPEFLRGADIRQLDKLTWCIKTSWGESKGEAGKAYWVKYGIENGKLSANILTCTENSFLEYYYFKDGKPIRNGDIDWSKVPKLSQMHTKICNAELSNIKKQQNKSKVQVSYQEFISMNNNKKKYYEQQLSALKQTNKFAQIKTLPRIEWHDTESLRLNTGKTYNIISFIKVVLQPDNYSCVTNPSALSDWSGFRKD